MDGKVPPPMVLYIVYLYNVVKGKGFMPIRIQ